MLPSLIDRIILIIVNCIRRAGVYTADSVDCFHHVAEGGQCIQAIHGTWADVLMDNQHDVTGMPVCDTPTSRFGEAIHLTAFLITFLNGYNHTEDIPTIVTNHSCNMWYQFK